MIGVLLGAALVVGGLSQLSSEPTYITQFHAECTDREVVIFRFDMIRDDFRVLVRLLLVVNAL